MRTTHDIADLIASLAKAQGVSVNGMLLECGAGISLVSNLRQGKIPSSYRLKLVADYFNVSIDYLLSGQDSSPSDDAPDDIIFVVPTKLKNLLSDLTPEELDEVTEFAKFIKARQKSIKKKN